MLKDYEIARDTIPKNILDVTNGFFDKNKIVDFGNYTAKVIPHDNNKKAKLILVTATSPTKAGEGKTTTTIGLVDGLNSLGKKTIGCLREPAMGPVFGLKGGACGGGYSQVIPMNEINLHFTGDLAAITAANNLICAVIDNHIFQGNELGFKSIEINRCMDVNDRALRNIKISYGFKNNNLVRDEHFVLSVATEIMATLCICKDSKDFENKINKMVIGFNENDEPIYLEQLKITGSVLALLKMTFYPNVVQTLENNPVLMHGGPFANIAHGCNSLIATKQALCSSDYVVTEAGFGSDLGAEKFMNIKSRIGELKPNLVVLVSTLRSLKLHGGVEDNDLNNENVEAVKRGLKNLKQHIKIISSFNTKPLVVINEFACDTEKEKQVLFDFLDGEKIEYCIQNSFKYGSNGSLEVSKKIINLIDKSDDFKIKYTYNIEDDYVNKLKKVCKEIYGAADIKLEQEVINKLNIFKKNGFNDLLICVAKTPVTFKDNIRDMSSSKDFTITFTDVKLNNSTGFLVFYAGNVMTMPGLNKSPNAHNIKYNNGEIIGLS